MAKLDYMVPAGAGKPAWADEGRTRINITVVFPHLGGEEVRYTASQSDPGWEHSEEIFARAKAGEFGPIADYVAPPAPIPTAISDRQLARELKGRGLISQLEAEAFCGSGIIPEPLTAKLNALVKTRKLTARERDDLRIDLVAERSYARDSRLIAVIGLALGMTGPEMDEFFRGAAAL